MGADTKIEWTNHTFNIVWGCTKVSPACHHCYAETFAKRVGFDIWGQDKPRRTFGEKHWAEPLKWNRDAERLGVRRRVFCSSMADVFEDHPTMEQERPKLWKLIEATPALDWLLLTKRPENHWMVPILWTDGHQKNVWFGTTVENQEYADKRIPHLLAAPWPAKRFLSVEPMLGPVDLHPGVLGSPGHLAETFGTPLIHWVICGAESGHHSRPLNEDWVRSLRDQCEAAGASFFLKQFADDKGRKFSLPMLDGRQWAEVP